MIGWGVALIIIGAGSLLLPMVGESRQPQAAPPPDATTAPTSDGVDRQP